MSQNNDTKKNAELQELLTHTFGGTDQHKTRKESTEKTIEPPEVQNPGPYHYRNKNQEQ